MLFITAACPVQSNPMKVNPNQKRNEIEQFDFCLYTVVPSNCFPTAPGDRHWQTQVTTAVVSSGGSLFCFPLFSFPPQPIRFVLLLLLLSPPIKAHTAWWWGALHTQTNKTVTCGTKVSFVSLCAFYSLWNKMYVNILPIQSHMLCALTVKDRPVFTSFMQSGFYQRSFTDSQHLKMSSICVCMYHFRGAIII